MTAQYDESMYAVWPPCLWGFVRLCTEASTRGWHEANGGNLSYRLTEEDLRMFASLFKREDAWHALKQPVPELAGMYFLMTASGAYLSSLANDGSRGCGVIELDADGSAWRVRWGFEDGAHPSSELETHLAAFTVALCAGDGADRVVYHAHCPHVIALSTLLEPQARMWTRTLWRIMTEGIIVFPQGVGVLPWMVPGSPELATATCKLMAHYTVCIWTQHGVMSRAASFEKAFGAIETVEKSAAIYLEARAANGGAEPPHLVSDDQLRAVCARYGLHPNEDFLD